MSEQEWKQFLDSVELRNLPWHLTLTLEQHESDHPFLSGTHLHAVLHTKDRDSGAPLCVHAFERLPRVCDDPSRLLRRMLSQLVLHELDECLVIGGARPFDPHRAERGASP